MWQPSATEIPLSESDTGGFVTVGFTLYRQYSLSGTNPATGHPTRRRRGASL